MCKNVYYYFYENQLKGEETNEMLSSGDQLVTTLFGQTREHGAVLKQRVLEESSVSYGMLIPHCSMERVSHRAVRIVFQFSVLNICIKSNVGSGYLCIILIFRS